MIKFEFQIGKKEYDHTHLDIELFYCLEGRVDFVMEDKEYTMEAEDFLIVNSGRRHSYAGSSDALVGCFHIPYDELAKLLKQSMVLFWCNSTKEGGELYEEVREVLKKIINQHYYHSGEDMIYLYSLEYELLHMLQNDFLLTEEDSRYKGELHKFDDRKQKIAEYIRQNYDKTISLSDLADHLYLSTAYLSKYIKKQFGMSFVDYVTSVRLSYALSELLYSDKPVVRIAMDTGFANSAAFNKAFKEKYNTTPSVYRGQWHGEPEIASADIREQKKLKKYVDDYFKKNQNVPVGQTYIRDIVLKNSEGQKLDRYWQKMINGGTAADLLRFDMQQQIKMLHDRLKFEYVRFWDIYSPEMFLDRPQEGGYNFSRLDMVIDFLTENQMKPYIELGTKTKKILKNRKNVLIGRSNDAGIFGDAQMTRTFMKELIRHLMERYGIGQVKSWYFELWKTEQDEYYFKKDIPDVEGMFKAYYESFDVVAKALREELPDVAIGGGGFSLRHGKDKYKHVIELWKDYTQKPSFITMYSYSYPAELDVSERVRNQSMDKDFLKNFLNTTNELLGEVDMGDLPVHLTEWNYTVSNRNVFNDSCQKGAYIIKNVMDMYGKIPMAGYWCASDIFSEYYDTSHILFGGSGLLTRNGVCKPAYYAMEFLDHLGDFVYQKGENYIISGDGKEYWYIICHNYKHFNYQYGLRNEDDVHVDELKHLISDNRKLRLKFTLPLQPGIAGNDDEYSMEIKTYAVNEAHGSIQDEWIRAGMPSYIHPEDMNYLKNASVPSVRVRNVKTQEQKICFETLLDANEFQWVQVKIGQNKA